MSTVRRFLALSLTSLVLVGYLATVPAGADTTTTKVLSAEAYTASASARGLALSLLNNPLTIGVSDASIDSTPVAKADGAGVLELLGGTTHATATANAAGQSQAPPPACALNVPVLGLLTLATACGQAQAALTSDGLPSAQGAGSVAEVDLAGSLLTPLLDAVGNLVGQTVGGAVNSLTQLLGGLLNPLLSALNLNLQSTVQQLFDGLKKATGVLTLKVGSSASAATTNATDVDAVATAQGAEIDVLPGLAPLGAPLATIIVGDAKAAVDVKRPPASQNGPVAATATPSFDPALVRVELGLPILGNVTDIPVALGAPLTLLAGTPLESTISVGGGSVGDGPNGTKTAVADGVSLQLLKGLSGGILISLAHAEAVGGGQSEVLAIQQVNTPVTQPTPLPNTGGPGGWLPLLGGAFLVAGISTRRYALSRR